MLAQPSTNPGASSLSPQIPIHELGYQARLWNVEHGLPADNVTCLAQTADGYLWIGTWNGLGRFDGVRFRVFDTWEVPELGSKAVLKLLASDAERLWIRSARGEISLRENALFHSVSLAPEPNPPDGAVALDPEGNLFVASTREARIQRWDGQRLTTIAQAADGKSVRQFVVDRDHTLWGAWEPDQALFRVQNGAFHSVKLPAAGSESGTGCFFLRPDRSAALLTPQGFWEQSAGEWALRRKFPQRVEGFWEAACQDGYGTVWFAIHLQGLFASFEDGRLMRVKLPDTGAFLQIQAMLTDREGNVWIGSEPEGLFRIRPADFRTWLEGDGLSHRRVNAVRSDANGGVWFTCRGDVHWLPPGARTPVRPPVSEVGSRSLASARGGGIWASSIERQIFRITADEPPRLFGRFPGTRGPDCMYESRDGTLWAAESTRLWRGANNEFVLETAPGLPTNAAVSTISDDGQGRLYAVVSEVGLFRREARGWQALTQTNDAGSTRLRALCVDSNCVVWAAAQRPGLSRWKEGRWFAFEGKSGTVPAFGAGVILDDVGGLWLATDHGIGRFAVAELNRWAEGGEEARGTWFDREDGLGSIDCSVLPNGRCQANDGRLWFATANGLSVVDPRHLQSGAEDGPPPVHIEEVLIDDRPAPLSARVTVPPGGHRVEFRFTALNLSAPEKSIFEYRLVGLEPDWVNAGTRRAAYYPKLPPGEYRFQVAAANKHLVWNREGDSLALIVQPAWWQTNLFRAALGGGVVLAVGLSFHRRVSRLKRENARRHEFSRQLIASQEAERKRIAGELHDSLGQNLLVIKNELYLVEEQLLAQPAHAKRLQEIGDSVTQSIDEVRGISRQLHPHQLERLGLTRTIEATAKRVAQAAQLRLETDLEPVDRLLPPEGELNLFRIVQEGLNNVVKHARASRLRITIRRDDGWLRLGLEDDGCGFDPAATESKPGVGLGLTDLRERTLMLRGTFLCESAPGAGTKLKFNLPIEQNNCPPSPHRMGRGTR